MHRPASQGNAIAALIVGILSLCLCSFLSVPGIVLAIVGMTQVNSNPKSSRTFTMIAWILIGVGIIFSLISLFAGFADAWFSPTYYYDTYEY